MCDLFWFWLSWCHCHWVTTLGYWHRPASIRSSPDGISWMLACVSLPCQRCENPVLEALERFSQMLKTMLVQGDFIEMEDMHDCIDMDGDLAVFSWMRQTFLGLRTPTILTHLKCSALKTLTKLIIFMTNGSLIRLIHDSFIVSSEFKGALLRPHQGMMVVNNPWCSWFHGCSLFAEADSFEVMKQNKLGTFDLTQIAGGPLGNFAQQAPQLGRDGLLWKWLKWYYIYIYICIYDMIYASFYCEIT